MGSAPGSRCPRCGRPAGAGPYCPHCGRYVAPLVWVAEPPPSAAPRTPAEPRPAYDGPPRYATPPRWGFPAAPWTPPEPAAPVPVGPLQAARALVGTLVPLLWATAAVALLAAAAEGWRYGLLLASRTGALSAGTVASSDAFVASAGVVAPVLAAVTGGLVVLWSVRASQAAAEGAGVRASRSPRQVVLGWLVPGLQLVVPGSVLAEVEHTALGLPADARPRPSRLLRVWWALWAADGVLVAVVLLWSLRDGVQARADGVLLHVVLDVVAAATAAVTTRVVLHLTALLGPARPRRREVLVGVGPAPAAGPVSA